MTSRIHQLARKLSFARIPETCPQVHGAGTAAIGKFHAWLERRAWIDKLSDKEAKALEERVGELAADFLQGAKENGTMPLRAALIAETEENLRLRLSAERVAQIEAGDDLQASELLCG